MIELNKSEYMKKYMYNYLGTKKGFLIKQFARFNERHMCDISKNDFINFSINDDLFNSLFDIWLISGRKTCLKPSVDRIDDYKKYKLGNIQWLTWEQNWLKGQLSEKIKPTRKNLTSYTKNHIVKVRVHELNKDFSSIKECAKELHLSNGFISRCITGTRKSVDYTFTRLEVHADD